MIHRRTFFGVLFPAILVIALACGSSGGAAGSREAVQASQALVTGAADSGVRPAMLQGVEEPSLVVSAPPVADVVEMVRPAVVSVVAQVQDSDFFFGARSSVQSGTGFFISSDGYVVTNNHVIEGANRIQVTTDDFRTYEAEIVGTDPGTDLAVLKVQSEETFPTVPFADPNSVRVGDWVIAIGNALGLPGGPTVTVGVVGALDRTINTGDTSLTDLVQTDAAINSGNSGGPLVNLKGEVVGINTVIIARAQGIGFSVGTFTAIPVVRSILESGRVVWPWLGVGVNDVSTQLALELDFTGRQGVLIVGIVPGSPAEKAGIEDGDVVITMDGSAVSSVRELQGLMREQVKVSQEITVELWRDGQSLEVQVTLAEMPRQR